MANDLMRTGPRGASDQAANLSPKVIRLIPLTGGTSLTTLADLQGVTSRALLNGEVASPPVSPVNYEAAKNTATVFYGLPGSGQDDTWYGQWIVRRMFATCTAQGFASDSGVIVAGIYAQSAGTLTAVDVNAIKAGGVIPAAGLAQIGMVYQIALGGAGEGLADNGGTGTGLVSYKLGVGAGQYTDTGADVRGQTQFLGVSVPAVGGNGKYALYAELVPAGGENYSK